MTQFRLVINFEADSTLNAEIMAAGLERVFKAARRAEFFDDDLLFQSASLYYMTEPELRVQAESIRGFSQLGLNKTARLAAERLFDLEDDDD